MFLVLGLAAGLTFGVGSALAGRLSGTLLNVVPVGLWFVALGIVLRDGLTEHEFEHLGAAMVGILLGLLAGPILERRRATPPER